VIEKLKNRARQNGRSLEAELRLILPEAAGDNMAQIQLEIEHVRAMFAGRTFSDSAGLLREDRERFLPEVHAEAARRLLNGSHILLAPDLLFPEAGNVLWKRVQRAEITETEAIAILHAPGKIPLQVYPSWPLVVLALEIACRAQRTVYDGLYLHRRDPGQRKSCHFPLHLLRAFVVQS